jgi:DNA-binding transcriptional MerR regulator
VTIRVYHDKGLLPEPPRDASGYRRYSAQDLVELIKIRTLAEAGLPLATIAHLATASPPNSGPPPPRPRAS